LVVLAAAGGAVFLVRRFGAGNRQNASRAHQSRLSMVDQTSIIDGRKLVIVRRDNVEHLLLIGGATDVLVEANIVRSPVAHAGPQVSEIPARVTEPEPPARLAPEPVARVSPPEPEDLPLAEGAKWPLQPEPAQRPKRTFEDGGRWPLQPPNEPLPRFSRSEPRSAQPESPIEEPAPAIEEPKEEKALPTDHFAELAAALQRPAEHETARSPEPPKSPPMRTAASSASAADGSNLNDMAHRLEAALRRPLSAASTATQPPRVEPRRPLPTFAATPSPQRAAPSLDTPRAPPRLVPEARQAPEPATAADPQAAPELHVTPEPRPSPEPRVAPEPRLTPEPKTDGASSDAPAFESLEREMASLLGRPPR
jgi:flagellar protein FliO/FliZ